MEGNDELLGPGELGSRIGYSVSGVKKLERLGIIPPAMRLVGSGRRVWKGADVPVIEERIKQRRADLAGSSRPAA